LTALISPDITIAQSLLEQGKVVAIPTETVYGLAGNALDLGAVAEIFRVKNRPTFDPLIIHVGSVAQMLDYVSSFPDNAQKLAKQFMPGPLTLLLSKRDIVPDLVTSGSPLVAIRIPAHPLTNALLNNLSFPLAAPSANPFGYISPTSSAHVAAQLGEHIPFILEGGPCEVGVESTIVGFDEATGQGIVYRKGGLAVEDIEAVIGEVQVISHSSSNPQAPGMLKSHYAPRLPFLLGDIETLISQHSNKSLAVLSFQKLWLSVAPEHQRALSLQGDMHEAARNLFGFMRELDALPVELIVAELLPETGLGRAINDRLRRAAAAE